VKILNRVILVGALGVVVTTPVNAASSDGYYTVYGFGAKTCEYVNEFIQKNGVSSYGAIDSYVSGYLSATNQLTEGVDDISGDLQPRQAMRKVLDYCDQNPGVTFQEAIADFVKRRATSLIIQDHK
jgi:hypothetical protein